MNILLHATILLIWGWIFLAFMGALCCLLYSRYSAKKNNTSEKNFYSSSKTSSEKHSPFRRFLRTINSYLYGLCRYYSILIGKIPSHRIRKFLLKTILNMKIAKKTVIYGGFEFRSPWNIELGECVIGVNALLDGRRGITICDGVCLAQNVSVYTEQHDINDPLFRTNDKGGSVYIEEMAWISARTTILPKINIGKGAVLAAGAVATKNLEAYGVYAGIPAKQIAERNKKIDYCVVDHYWHFY